MRQTFNKLGLDRVEEDVIEGIYYVFDPQGTGSIMYHDFCLKFYEHANSKSIKDTKDEFFVIFDSVRKYLKQMRSSLASVFAVDLNMYY
jgi:hypothetical protein